MASLEDYTPTVRFLHVELRGRELNLTLESCINAACMQWSLGPNKVS